MSQFPWFAWIAIAIASTLGCIYIVVVSILAKSTKTSRAMVERLDRIDARLATIEKTLTDIQ